MVLRDLHVRKSVNKMGGQELARRDAVAVGAHDGAMSALRASVKETTSAQSALFPAPMSRARPRRLLAVLVVLPRDGPCPGSWCSAGGPQPIPRRPTA
jgi:hypothetical protein